MPINRTIFEIIIWGIIPTPNVINFIWLESWMIVEANHHHGFDKWKHFKMHFWKWERIMPYRWFCTFAKEANVIMS